MAETYGVESGWGDEISTTSAQQMETDATSTTSVQQHATDDPRIGGSVMTDNEENYFYAGFNGFYPGKKDPGHSRSAFYVNHNKWARTRVAADKYVRGSRMLRIFGPHTSEADWALSRKHPRHLLNFPRDILLHIMSFALVTPYDLSPNTVFCDNMKDYTGISYKIGLTGSTRKGPYRTEEYSGYTKKPIDATILRVCKLLHQEGIPLLYGENDFVFDLNSYESHWREHVQRDKRRTRTMPWQLDSEEVQSTIRDMVNISGDDDLPDWIYCDRFSRFLHSIGPDNASIIRKLRLVGSIFPSSRSWGYGSYTAWDDANIAYYLQAYTPFIIQYCPNLVKFGIGISKFFLKDYTRHHIHGVRDDGVEDWFETDPQDEDEQSGDDIMDEMTLKVARKSREQNRLKKRTAALWQKENSIALAMKPLLDSLIPKLKKLQVLEAKRCPASILHEAAEPTMPYDHDTFQKFADTIPWPDLELADEAKSALAIAVFRRSKEMERMAVAKKMEALRLRDMEPGAGLERGDSGHVQRGIERSSRGGSPSFIGRGSLRG